MSVSATMSEHTTPHKYIYTIYILQESTEDRTFIGVSSKQCYIFGLLMEITLFEANEGIFLLQS